MKSSKAIKFKAFFLLATFSLNSVVGVACSLGVDMGFNSKHHEHHDEEEISQSYTDDSGGSGKHHDENLSFNHKHDHSDEYNASDNIFVFNASEDENCCNSFVTAFQNLDKQLVEKSQTTKAKNIFTPFILQSPTLQANYAVHTKQVKAPLKTPNHSPPDIRIFIQSFQI